jgi:hypothetical protein
LKEFAAPVFLNPKDLLSLYENPAFKLRVIFFFILEKEALEDLLRITIPSTAKTAVAITKNNNVVVILAENVLGFVLRFVIPFQN